MIPALQVLRIHNESVEADLTGAMSDEGHTILSDLGSASAAEPDVSTRRCTAVDLGGAAIAARVAGFFCR